MPQTAKSSDISSDDSAADSSLSQDVGLEFYPAFCYQASPTWFTWVKLTVYDIHHRLQTRQKPSSAADNDNTWAQNQTLLLFYMNHPIQFVQLVGVVVTFEDYFDKFWLFALDDSSGATIEINCRKPEKDPNETGDNLHSKKTKDPEADKRNAIINKLEIGTVVQVKGQVKTFRNVRQLQLERISIIHDTNEEMRLISARTHFHTQVLTRPWVLSLAKQKSLKADALGESKEQQERSRKRQKLLQLRMEREKRHTERIASKYEQEERKREHYAEQARKAGLLLKSMR